MATQDEQDRLIAESVAAFALTDDEIQRMAEAIYNARVDAARAAYEEVAEEVGAEDFDESDFELPDDLLSKLAEEALANARQIAATYRHDLERKSSALLLIFLRDHDDELTGARASLAHDLAQWADERAEWKSEQIAGYETGAGAGSGTGSAIDDLVSGDLTPDDEIVLDSIMVTILPDSAAEPFCADYAGETFTLDEALAIIDIWPAHGGCPHEAYVYVAS